MQFADSKVLSENEIRQINDASLSVLADAGIAVHSEEVLELLRNGGAQVERGEKRARIPRRMVEECVASVPATFPVYNTNREQAFTIGEKPCRHCTGFDELSVPLPSGQWRPLTKRDVEAFSIVADALENVDMVGPQGMPQDVMAAASILHGVDAVFRHTAKPLFFAVDARDILTAVLDLTRVVVDDSDLAGHPPLIVQISPSSPLFWTKGAAESLIEAATCGVPINCLPQPMAGASAPLTLAGELIIGNSEYLSSCVITQLARKGAPLLYGAAWTTLNMHYSNALFATPEAMLLRIAGIQMAHYYGKPAHVQGLNADAPIFDEQLGWEKCLTAMMGLGAGADLIVGGGAFGTAMVSSNEQLVIDDEILGILRRLQRGINVTEGTMALDLIKSVGPQGNFLAEEHTVHHLRTGEHFHSGISNKDMYEVWKKKGLPSIVDNARDKAEEILAHHRPRRLPEATVRRMREVIEAYEASVKSGGR